MRAAWLVVGSVVGVLAGCRDTCVNGESQECACTDGRSGAQVCRSDGFFDPCVCSGVPGTGGGAPAGGGTGGFGGGTGLGGGTGFGGGAGFGGGTGGSAVPRPFVDPLAALHLVAKDTVVLQVPHDGGGLALTWRWQVTGPDGGLVSVLDDAARADPVLTPPVPGTYLVQVTVTSDGGSDSATFPVRASSGKLLPWEPTAFAGHRATNRLALAAPTNFRLELHDTVAGTSAELTVGRAPLALAFTPDGTRLVVAQDAQVQVVTLTESTPRVLATWPIVGTPSLIAASNTHAYFPDSDRDAAWLRLDTGETGTRFAYDNLGALRLHPDGDRLYGVSTNVSPDDVIRWDLDAADGGVNSTGNSPYHGTYSPCGNLWLSRDGALAYTGCGVAYRLQRSLQGDMVYGGSLPTQRYVGMDESTDGGLVFGLAQPLTGSFSTPTYGTSLALIIERASLRQITVAPLPDTTGLTTGRYRARFLFVDSADQLHLFLTGAAGVPSYRAAWLTRTVGDL